MQGVGTCKHLIKHWLLRDWNRNKKYTPEEMFGSIHHITSSILCSLFVRFTFRKMWRSWMLAFDLEWFHWHICSLKLTKVYVIYWFDIMPFSFFLNFIYFATIKKQVIQLILTMLVGTDVCVQMVFMWEETGVPGRNPLVRLGDHMTISHADAGYRNLITPFIRVY